MNEDSGLALLVYNYVICLGSLELVAAGGGVSSFVASFVIWSTETCLSRALGFVVPGLAGAAVNGKLATYKEDFL